MKDIPIIFSGPMVRALFDGRKTMTRRLAWRENGKPSPWCKAMPLDRLWVRETWQLHDLATDKATVAYAASVNGAWSEAHEQFDASHARGLKPKPFQEGWRSPLHLPRWASRLTLVVNREPRLERLNEISDADAVAEGLIRLPARRDGFGNDWHYRVEGLFYIGPSPVTAFSHLWREIHGDVSWDENPEVVALTFTVHKQNIDAMPKAEAA